MSSRPVRKTTTSSAAVTSSIPAGTPRTSRVATDRDGPAPAPGNRSNAGAKSPRTPVQVQTAAVPPPPSATCASTPARIADGNRTRSPHIVDPLVAYPGRLHPHRAGTGDTVTLAVIPVADHERVTALSCGRTCRPSERLGIRRPAAVASDDPNAPRRRAHRRGRQPRGRAGRAGSGAGGDRTARRPWRRSPRSPQRGGCAPARSRWWAQRAAGPRVLDIPRLPSRSSNAGGPVGTTPVLSRTGYDLSS